MHQMCFIKFLATTKTVCIKTEQKLTVLRMHRLYEITIMILANLEKDLAVDCILTLLDK